MPSGRTLNDETVLLPMFVTNRQALLSPSEASSTLPAESANGRPNGGFAAGCPLPPVRTSPAAASFPSAPRWKTATLFGTVFVCVKTAPGVNRRSFCAAWAGPAAPNATTTTPSARNDRRRRTIKSILHGIPSPSRHGFPRVHDRRVRLTGNPGPRSHDRALRALLQWQRARRLAMFEAICACACRASRAAGAGSGAAATTASAGAGVGARSGDSGRRDDRCRRGDNRDGGQLTLDVAAAAFLLRALILRCLGGRRRTAVTARERAPGRSAHPYSSRRWPFELPPRLSAGAEATGSTAGAAPRARRGWRLRGLAFVLALVLLALVPLALGGLGRRLRLLVLRLLRDGRRAGSTRLRLDRLRRSRLRRLRAVPRTRRLRGGRARRSGASGLLLGRARRRRCRAAWRRLDRGSGAGNRGRGARRTRGCRRDQRHGGALARPFNFSSGVTVAAVPTAAVTATAATVALTAALPSAPS